MRGRISAVVALDVLERPVRHFEAGRVREPKPALIETYCPELADGLAAHGASAEHEAIFRPALIEMYTQATTTAAQIYLDALPA